MIQVAVELDGAVEWTARSADSLATKGSSFHTGTTWKPTAFSFANLLFHPKIQNLFMLSTVPRHGECPPSRHFSIDELASANTENDITLPQFSFNIIKFPASKLV